MRRPKFVARGVSLGTGLDLANEFFVALNIKRKKENKSFFPSHRIPGFLHKVYRQYYADALLEAIDNFDVGKWSDDLGIDKSGMRDYLSQYKSHIEALVSK